MGADDRFYVNRTWDEIKNLDRRNTIILLPVGSVEQHGPHLPLDTDSLTAAFIAQKLAETPGKFKFMVAPTLCYTYAKPSLVFPGTLSLEGETLIRLVRDILKSFLKQGFGKILVLNAHMENTDFLIEGIALALEGSESAKTILINWWEIIAESDLIRIFGPDWQGWVDEHAALVETSLLMFMAPERVKVNRIVDGQRQSRLEFRILPWEMKNFPESGVFSAIRGAHRDKGQQLLELILKELTSVIEAQFKI
jgi:creatinine amidohydrolase